MSSVAIFESVSLILYQLFAEHPDAGNDGSSLAEDALGMSSALVRPVPTPLSNLS